MTKAEQLGITEFPYIEYDSNDNVIYHEESYGTWYKCEFDNNNNEIYFENSQGYWAKKQFDSNNNEILYENSNGYWMKTEYNSSNNKVYFESSDGIISHYEPKQLKIMTPKEKAKQLYNTFYNTNVHPNSVQIRSEIAKQCALIAVDEILSFIEDDRIGFTCRDYYKEVKQEIKSF